MKRAVTAAALGLYVTIITGCAAPPPPPGAAYGSREEQCHEYALVGTGVGAAYKYSQSESGYRQAYVDCVVGRAR
jgi:hypothetical protein